MQDTLASVHYCQLIPAHQLLAELLIVGAVTGAVSPGVGSIEGIDRFLAQSLCQFLQCCRLRAAKEDLAVAVADDGICIVLVDGFQLAPCLQDKTGRYLTASDRGDQLLQVRDLADVRHLIDQAPDMDRKPAAVNVVRFLTEQVEELRIRHTDKEVESAVRIAHDQEQCRFLIPEGVQFQFVVGRQLPELLDIKDGKPCPAGNQDRLRRLTCC